MMRTEQCAAAARQFSVERVEQLFRIIIALKA